MTTTTLSASPFSPTWRALSVGLILSVLLIAFESLAVATALPTVARDLAGLRLYGWSFSAFFMGYLLSTVTLGTLADRLGPARPFALALALFAVGLLVAGLAPNMPVFILGRTLQGLGGGGLIAVAYLAINRAFPDAMRARMLALLSSAWVLPALVGPAVAGAVAQRFSWRAVFLGLLPLLALVAPLALPALRKLRGGEAPLGDVPLDSAPLDSAPLNWSRPRAALLAAVGVTLLLAALSQRSAWLGLPLGLAGLAAAVPALRALFPPETWRASTPLAAGYATRFTLTCSFFGAEAFVPLGLSALRGFTLTHAGLALTFGALAWSLTSILHSRLDERTGGRLRGSVARAGVTLVTLSIVLTGLAILRPGLPAWLPGLTWALGGLGMGLAFQSHTLVVFRHAPPGQEGQVSGTLQVADVLGSAIGAGVGGALVAALGLRLGLTGLFGLAALVAASGWWATRRLKGRAAAS